jgi:hypothetical protein
MKYNTTKMTESETAAVKKPKIPALRRLDSMGVNIIANKPAAKPNRGIRNPRKALKVMNT